MNLGKLNGANYTNELQTRQRMQPWLKDRINSQDIRGLEWIDKNNKVFKVPWKHVGNREWKESDGKIFKEWAIHTGRYREGVDAADWQTWKTRFRCALTKLPDIKELKDQNRLDGQSEEPYRVYQFLKSINGNSANQYTSMQQMPFQISPPGFDKVDGLDMISDKTKREQALCISGRLKNLTSDMNLGEVNGANYTNELQTRQRMQPWLKDRINSQDIRGLEWIDKNNKVFKVPWKHVGNREWKESDGKIFKEWAIHTGRYREGVDAADWQTWKTRFRCALTKLPDIKELKDQNRLDGQSEEPYRVYQFLKSINGNSANQYTSMQQMPFQISPPGFDKVDGLDMISDKTREQALCISGRLKNLTSDMNLGEVNGANYTNERQTRQRMQPWLKARINSQDIRGLEWIDKSNRVFKVPWKHLGNREWTESDGKIFKEWAIHTGRYREGVDAADWQTWKIRFRCALTKLPDIKELNDQNRLDGQTEEPYRVYQFLKSTREGANNEKGKVAANSKTAIKKRKIEKVEENTGKGEGNVAANGKTEVKKSKIEKGEGANNEKGKGAANSKTAIKRSKIKKVEANVGKGKGNAAANGKTEVKKRKMEKAMDDSFDKSPVHDYESNIGHGYAYIAKAEEDKPSVNKELVTHVIWTWKTCLKKKSKSAAKTLIDKGQLPNGQEFIQACILWRNSDSDMFKDICNSICKFIKSKSDSITSVYAAYKADTADTVVFVVKVENGTFSDISEYNCKLRYANEYSSEGRDVTAYEKRLNKFFTKEESTKLRTCLQKHSTRLMNNHSNLKIISASSFKSENYELRKGDPIPKACIVFYVDFKGYIPINEEPFETHLDDFPVDVREGSFMFCGPADIQKRLKMGCQIGGCRVGTLGAFLNVQNQVCCLTSAHVILSDEELYRLTDLNLAKEQTWSVMMGPKVYQPNTTKADEEYFGNVIQAVYRPGEGNRAGIEVALVAMNRRKPEDGSFPGEYASSAGNADIRFTSGQICTPSPSLEGMNVIMFGSKSGFTKGRYRFHGMTTRGDHTVRVANWAFPLINQIVIQSYSDDRPFGQEGDSGALVFVEFPSNPLDLRAIGLFEGKTNDNLYIATPICDILEALGNPKLMTFQNSALEETMFSRMDTQMEQLGQMLSDQIGRKLSDQLGQIIKETLNQHQTQNEQRLARCEQILQHQQQALLEREQSEIQRLSLIEENPKATLSNNPKEDSDDDL